MNTSNKPKLIGLAGTNGAGKDSVEGMLEKEFGYLFISGTDLLRAEATQRGLSNDRSILRTISSEWREKLGGGAFVKKILEKYGDVSNGRGIVMASLRSPDEVDEIHQRGGLVLWIDADQRLRYERVSQSSRGRNDEDQKAFEQFVKEEEIEMQGGTKAKGLNMGAVKEKCDYFIQNNTSLETLKSKLIEIVDQKTNK
jgi:cytidylate kinase